MKALFRSWWRQISQRRVVIAVTTAIIMIAIASIIVGYWFDVTGFNGSTQVSTIRTLSGPTAGTITRTETYQTGKTLWDWMQLLFIPVVLAAAGFWFNHRDMSLATLCNVNFDEADFTSADLRSANMILASLCFARLNDADLRSAKMNGADLRGVDLRHTHLDTNLNDAKILSENRGDMVR